LDDLVDGKALEMAAAVVLVVGTLTAGVHDGENPGHDGRSFAV
jgi:hypothetical protein